MDHEPFAYFGGVLATGLRDLTDDPQALDSQGWWAVVRSYEGALVCARFDDVRAAAAPPVGSWSGPPVTTWTSSLDEAAYIGGVTQVRELIAAGEVYQANVCRLLSAPLPDARRADIAGLAGLLAQGNPAPHAGVVRIPHVRGDELIQIATASPELYLRRAGTRIESRPIKGTGRTADEITDKDRAENVMIVDLVRNDLGVVCETGSVEVPELCVLEAHPGLVHLVSTVTGRLRPDVGWPELFEATFPPGSVTGAPKIRAVQALADIESTPRGPYCGAVGWVDADRRTAELAVAIRTFWIEDGRLWFGTGAGITWGSDPAREWAETELKARHLLTIAADRVAVDLGPDEQEGA